MNLPQCQYCETPCEQLSHYCSWCGKKLAILDIDKQYGHVNKHKKNEVCVFIPEELLFIESGEPILNVDFAIQNSGLSSMFLYLHTNMETKPKWVVSIDGIPQDDVFKISGGESKKITVKILKNLLQRQLQESESIEFETTGFSIEFWSSACQEHEGSLIPVTQILSILPDRPSHIKPNLSIYRFIPSEYLIQHTLQHTIWLENPSSRTIDIKKIEFKDYPTEPSKMLGFSYPKHQSAHLSRISYEGLFSENNYFLTPISVAPLDRQKVVIEFKDKREEQEEIRLSWFAVQIIFYPKNSAPLIAIVAGVIGKQPDLVWKEYFGENDDRNSTYKKRKEITLSEDAQIAQTGIEVTNSGDIPIKVKDFKVWMADSHFNKGAEITEQDWLQISVNSENKSTNVQDNSYLVLPRKSRELYLKVDISYRKKHETDKFGYRVIRIEHTGIESEPLELFVTYKLGDIEHVGGTNLNKTYLCIDFGTSNTSVAIARGQPSTIHPSILPLSVKESTKLKSLLFFQRKQKNEIDTTYHPCPLYTEHFLFEEQAKEIILNAKNDPLMLDNYIKTLKRSLLEAIKQESNEIAFDNPSPFCIMQYMIPSGQSVVWKKHNIYLQHLLNVFMLEVKKRAENSFAHILDKNKKINFSQKSTIRCTESIFTHPVLAKEELTKYAMALYQASQFAGMNTHKNDGSEMDFEYFCRHHLQNETQSALAVLIYKLSPGSKILNILQDQFQIQDFEKEKSNIPVLNIDMGGGTTDFTYMILKKENTAWVSENVLSMGEVFGGDHIDKILLQGLLKKFATRNGANFNSGGLIQDVLSMLDVSTFADFWNKKKHKLDTQSNDRLTQQKQENGYKNLYMIILKYLDEVEAQKIDNTTKFNAEDNSENRIDEKKRKIAKLSLSFAELAPKLGINSIKEETIELEHQEQKDILLTAMTPLLQTMDLLMVRSGAEYRFLYILLFSGQGYQFPLVKQILLDHMKQKTDNTAHKEQSDHKMLIIPEKRIPFDLKECVIEGACNIYNTPHAFQFVTQPVYFRRQLKSEVYLACVSIPGFAKSNKIANAEGDISVAWQDNRKDIKLYAYKGDVGQDSNEITQHEEVVFFDVQHVQNRNSLDKTVRIQFTTNDTVQAVLSDGQIIKGQIVSTL